MGDTRSKVEQQLWRAVVDGVERDAWRAFRERFGPVIRCCVAKTLRRYGATFSADDVDDLSADVWLQLLRDDRSRLRRYDPSRGFRLSTWLGMIATNYTIDHLRRSRAHCYVDDLPCAELPEQCAESPDQLVERREHRRIASAAMARMSQREREFLLACYRDERAPTELAAELGVAVNTVYSRKFKLRAKLGRIVADLCAPSAGQALATAAR